MVTPPTKEGTKVRRRRRPQKEEQEGEVEEREEERRLCTQGADWEMWKVWSVVAW